MISLLTGLALALSLTLSPAAGYSAPASNKPSDTDITYWIRYAITHDPRTAGRDITVETSDGIVKLRGEVDNLAAKNYAAAESKKIHGVRGVINEIAVKPVSRSDADIAHDVRQRLENSGAVDARDLVVAVHGATVTLSGSAVDWNQKEEARFLASEVRGVKDVTDEVDVRFTETKSDGTLAAESRARLERDAYLSDLPITAAVHNGVITLDGSVGNLYEKERAERTLRWQAGVKSVVNNLKVEPEEDFGVRDSVSVPSDDELMQNVKAEMETDLRLRPEDISVDAVAGHVMLFGSVPSLWEKRIAEQDARDVVGTAWVTDDLIVHPTERDDSAIKDQIVFNINSDPYLSKAKIGVSVAAGVVTLVGEVPSLFEKQHALDLAIDVMGVGRVVNNLTVKPMAVLTDDVLQNELVRRIGEDWKLAPISEDIQVQVQQGTVILTGDVDTWSERQEAARVALRTRGVLSVDDRLTVRGVPYPWDEWHFKMPGYFEPYYDIY
jgi:osmotically-inducible protein OsmY